MMSSSPPPNHNTEFNQSKTNNQTQSQSHLLSSPAFRESLNLQLSCMDTSIQHRLDSINNYTTNENQYLNPDSGSDTSLMYEHTQRDIGQHQLQQNFSQRHVSASQYPSQDRYHYQPQYSQQLQQQQYPQSYQSGGSNRYTASNADYADYVPISNNADPNLHFPSSSSYMNLSTSSSFNNNQQIPQSVSSNSLSSNILSTPHQSGRRLSFTANLMSSVNTVSNRSPATSAVTPVKASIVTPKVSYAHRRSKSKIAMDKSPGSTGNPFYNSSNFMSPKVTKKTHRKNISISNSIHNMSLSHLDTDLNLQPLNHPLGRSGSPNETPLRTPGRRNDYMYSNTIAYGQDEDEDEDVHDVIKNSVDEGEEGENEKHIVDSKDYSKYMKTENDSSSNTFIVPNVLMNNKFGGELVNATVTEAGTSQLHASQPSILDPVSVNDMNINFLDDIFADTAAVESLNDQILFQFPTQALEKNSSYFDTLDQLDQKQKYHSFDSEIQHTELEQDPDVPLPYIENAIYNKSSSVPQLRLNFASSDSKIQRSRSSFNLSSIASARDSKYYDQYNFQKPESLEPHLEASESFNIDDNEELISHTTSSSSLSSAHKVSKSGSLQEIAERGASAPSTSSSKEFLRTTKIGSSATTNILSSTIKATSMYGVKTRSKSKSNTVVIPNIQRPEKLDLPQQSARSKSRTKKSGNEDKKVHECPLCHMKFQRPEHVKRHMLSHSSEKPFACPELGCNKRFNRNDNLKQHLRNIHKKKI